MINIHHKKRTPFKEFIERHGLVVLIEETTTEPQETSFEVSIRDWYHRDIPSKGLDTPYRALRAFVNTLSCSVMVTKDGYELNVPLLEDLTKYDYQQLTKEIVHG